MGRPGETRQVPLFAWGGEAASELHNVSEGGLVPEGEFRQYEVTCGFRWCVEPDAASC
jgi:hypothetical protein